ncbi:Rieske (2Fe-2S) protein [Streptomyces decoyicus]|uniref:Rieske (2Fe-2S) protein n=1 Tax=Streptomyces decoyicus TaxID=249567 RepID=UPI00345D99B4
MARQAASERTETEAVTEETGQAVGRGAARRTVVAAVGAAGLTAALAACGGSTADAGSGASKVEGGDQAGSSGASGGGDGAAGGGGGGGGTILAKTSEIPKGGGKIFKADKVVVTQPQDGDIKAFSAICTHAGCVVGEVTGGTINCMCHGSKFDITDGSVKKGPATKGLAPAKVSVKGGSVTLD